MLLKKACWISLAALCACAGSTGQKKIASLDSGLNRQWEKYTNNDFSSLTDPVGNGRVNLPLSVYRKDLPAALGSVYAITAKEGKQCASDNPADFNPPKLLVLPERAAGCRIRTYQGDVLATMKLEGGQDADLKYIIGDISAKKNYAFEINISEPVLSGFEDTNACVKIDKVVQHPLENRTCRVLLIYGIALVQANYKSYKRLDISSDNSYASLIKIGGHMYDLSSDLVTKFVMLGDPLELTAHYERQKDNYLQALKKVPTDSHLTLNGLTDAQLKERFKLTPEAAALLRRLPVQVAQ